MRSSRTLSHLASALSGFALGVAAGMLFAPQSGEQLRNRIASEARDQLRQAEARLRDMEKQMRSLDERMAAAREQVGHRVRNVADQARETVLPSIGDAAHQAAIDEKELGQDLRHLTRR